MVRWFFTLRELREDDIARGIAPVSDRSVRAGRLFFGGRLWLSMSQVKDVLGTPSDPAGDKATLVAWPADWPPPLFEVDAEGKPIRLIDPHA